jgi:N6-L-threonylcarbamoyladenine synthase
MLILGIETSCDETSASLVEDGKKILSNIVFSQIEIHKKFNGVVPELASRNHLVKIIPILQEALQGFDWKDIDAVAAVNGPGLIGSILVGFTAAKGIAYARHKPLIPVDHISAHMYAPHLFHEIEFPYIGLVVSGGHTLLFLVHSFSQFEMLGSTMDDAVGEAYDKTARVLGLGYPGGPLIDSLAKKGNLERLPDWMDIPLLLPDKGKDRYNFSYSGLKTAIAYRLKKFDLNEENIPDVALLFQEKAIEMLLRKSRNALKDFQIRRLVVSGGVAANSHLRKKLDDLKKDSIEVFTAPLEFCTDNAAMVAGRGYADYQLGKIGDLRTEVYSRLPFVKKGKK